MGTKLEENGMLKRMKKVMDDGNAIENEKIVELTDEQLEAVQGGTWDFASKYDYNSQWGDAFAMGVQVVWREPGVGDHWCTVTGYEYIGSTITYFNLSCPSEGFTATNVPAGEVLIDFV